ncbi:uncharacterized protein LOC126905605 [Daktulosphaira vitifoliae]|uniref:uncharacterized protein LOC126905605 n=1 Tax=Daktulosphaira vitifoliae TaxID=58002 RepID=UPI0021A9C664|nr:uncharacterized protein LOC126905605 [Daktulosphaira vitifoliae]
MTGWPARTLLLLAFALSSPAIVWGNDDGQQQQVNTTITASWCTRPECTCSPVSEGRVALECVYTGQQNVVWEHDISNKNLTKSLSMVSLSGEGDTSIIITGKTFSQAANLVSLTITGFGEVSIKKEGLQIKNKGLPESVIWLVIKKAQRVYLDSGSIQPQTGVVDILIEDCDTVRLSQQIVSKLRMFTFRRIESLELSEKTFVEAAIGVIEQIIIENVFLDVIPSSAFVTSISSMLIRNCSIGLISREAFPKTMFTNITLVHTTIGRIESHAFRESAIMDNLRMTRCRVQNLEKGAIMAAVTDIFFEQSEFGTIESGAVTVAINLTLDSNTFQHVKTNGFNLSNWHGIRIESNIFKILERNAFCEYSTSSGSASSATIVRNLYFSNNILHPLSSESVPWTPAIRLRTAANTIRVTSNRLTSKCDCSQRYMFVMVDGSSSVISEEREFAENNYCLVDATVYACSQNLTSNIADYAYAAEFRDAAGCGTDLAVAYERCVRETEALSSVTEHPDGVSFRVFGTILGPKAERGVITTLVLLILCGFGTVCAVSAITWLNARGFFIKLRSLLTSNGTGGGRGVGSLDRTTSAHSLSPISVHEYAELQRNRIGNDFYVTAPPAVRVVVYQDRGTQTVPEELTQEMLQTLRDKLDDPEDYAEARDMIEHLYDLIRVEETCCGNSNSGGIDWYGGLDDMTSTTTTKAIVVGDGDNYGGGLNTKSVGTGAPSLEKLWPPKMTSINYKDRPQQPPPTVGDDYMDPADLYEELQRTDCVTDNLPDAHIYCELPTSPPSNFLTKYRV